MKRHPLDYVSLTFGILFAAMATWVLVLDEPLDFDEIRWIWPLFLVVAGLALVANLIPLDGRSGSRSSGDAGGPLADGDGE